MTTSSLQNSQMNHNHSHTSHHHHHNSHHHHSNHSGSSSHLHAIVNGGGGGSSSSASCTSSSSSGSASDRKRKRTSIAAPEKRSLEAYFNIQPRPSGEKIAQIADKLELKKNVVRVWFCNQRQKQKRMKFAAIQTR